VSNRASIKYKKTLYRKRYIKLLLNQHKEREEILLKELQENRQQIQSFEKEFKKLKEEDYNG